VKTAGLRDFQLQWYPGHIAEMEEELQGLEPGDPKVAALRENLIYNRLFFKALKENQDLLPPTLTFSDRMTLDLVVVTTADNFLGEFSYTSWYTEGAIFRMIARDLLPAEY